MSILFEQIKIGRVKIKNRFVHSGTFECAATEKGEVVEIDLSYTFWFNVTLLRYVRFFLGNNVFWGIDGRLRGYKFRDYIRMNLTINLVTGIIPIIAIRCGKAQISPFSHWICISIIMHWNVSWVTTLMRNPVVHSP